MLSCSPAAERRWAYLSRKAISMPQPSAHRPRKRILTGARPTSDAFHLGNYVGTLANRVRLQDEYDTFLLLADLHLLTTRINDLEEVGHNIHELVLDYLSVGIDHEKTTIYLQSLVPVGKDQLSHVELTREIARRFNDTFAPVFPVPDALVGSVASLPGTDGQTKMGKSVGNAILLTDDAE